LRHAGYSEKENESPLGSYRLHGGSIEIMPGPESYHSPEPATITVADGAVSAINSRSAGELEAYELEPQMLSSLFDAEQRSKRQLVKYDEIPKLSSTQSRPSRTAAFSAQRRQFHAPVEAAWIDFTTSAISKAVPPSPCSFRGLLPEPGENLSPQAHRNADRGRVGAEIFQTTDFEFYANRVDLGQRGSFTISGLAEGSRSYFNKDLKDITLPEALCSPV